MKTYTIKELIPILKATGKTIRNYIKQNKLKASFIGNRFIISETDLQEFLVNNQKYQQFINTT